MAELLVKRVGRHIAKVRAANGLRQVDISGLTELSQPIISEIENGRFRGLALNTLEKICLALNMSVKEFFDSMPGE